MEKIVLDTVALVSEAQYELLVTVMGIVLHQMPKNRPRANLHHGFRDVIDVASEPHPGSPAENNYFHRNSPSSIRPLFPELAKQGCRPLSYELKLPDDFVLQVPGLYHDRIRHGLADPVRSRGVPVPRHGLQPATRATFLP